MTGLEGYYPAVAVVHLGARAEDLATVFPINAGDPVTLPDDQKRLKYILKEVPGIPGDVLFVQFEYVDGTRSELREFKASDYAQTTGRPSARSQFAPALPPGVVELKVVGVPGKRLPPRAFEMLLDGKMNVNVEFAAEAAPETVRYGFEAVPETPAEFRGNVARIVEWSSSKRLRIAGTMKDGESNEYTIQLADPVVMAVTTIKGKMKESLPTAVACVRLPMPYPTQPAKPAPKPPVPPPVEPPKDGAPRRRTGPKLRDRMNEIAENQQAYFASEHLRLTLDTLYDMNGFQQDAGAVVCVPGEKRSLRSWIGIQEVHVGIRPGVVDQTVPVNLDWDHFLATGEERLAKGEPLTNSNGREEPLRGWQIWHARLAPDTKAVYIRFKYRDGTTGDELRFDVKPLPDAQ